MEQLTSTSITAKNPIQEFFIETTRESFLSQETSREAALDSKEPSLDQLLNDEDEPNLDEPNSPTSVRELTEIDNMALKPATVNSKTEGKDVILENQLDAAGYQVIKMDKTAEEQRRPDNLSTNSTGIK